MPVEDVFSITGRGTVATGRIETGIANSGDEVDIIGMGAEKLKSTITGIEMFRKNTEKLTKVLEAYKILKEYHDNFKYS